MRLEGRTAIVTGAGTAVGGVGNGKATALRFAHEGANVVVVDIDQEAATETRESIIEQGGSAIAITGDVSFRDDCRRIVNTGVSQYGRIDILHNNVGIERPAGLLTTNTDDWEHTLRTNLTSMLFMCQEAVPAMLNNQRGAIVNVASINAIRTLPALSLAYSVSKAGVVAFTREIAIEFAADGIRANAILPGMMATPFVSSSLTEAYGGNPAEMMALRDEVSPTGRQGESWDVASAALFLASDEAKYVTGTTLVVDGGQTKRVR